MNEDRRIIMRMDLDIPFGYQVEAKIISIEQSPRYFRIGNGVRNTFMKKTTIPIDAINELTDMTVQELWTIKLLRNNLIPREELVSKQLKLRTSCKSIITASELTSGERQKFQTGYKRLYSKNLLKRIKRQHYILNPDFFIPYFYLDEKELFDSLK